MYKILAKFTTPILLSLTCWITPANAELIQLDGGAISFEAPAEFTPLTASEIELKYLRGNPPRYVVGNAGRTTTIAYDLKPHNISEAELPQLKKVFTEFFSQAVPGIQWIENKFIEQVGRRWIYFEMTSSAIDTEIHNIMLVTPYNNELLMFNFSSTKQEFPEVESMLRDSLNSIQFNR